MVLLSSERFTTCDHMLTAQPLYCGTKVPKEKQEIAMKKMHQKGSALRVEEKEAAAKFVSERKMEHPEASSVPRTQSMRPWRVLPVPVRLVWAVAGGSR